MSKGESSSRVGTGIGARDGDAGDGLGEAAESELSSGGGVGGPERVFAGTDLDRNLGIGRAEGAGEAWKVGPAYAAWTLAGVPEELIGMASESVKGACAPAGEKTRSMEGWDWVCFFVLRGPLGTWASSPERTALSAKAGSVLGGNLLGDAAAPLCGSWPLCDRLPLGLRCDCLPGVFGGCAALCEDWGLPRGARGVAVGCVDM